MSDTSHLKHLYPFIIKGRQATRSNGDAQDRSPLVPTITESQNCLGGKGPSQTTQSKPPAMHRDIFH